VDAGVILWLLLQLNTNTIRHSCEAACVIIWNKYVGGALLIAGLMVSPVAAIGITEIMV
jgi:hypothetical protein